MICTCIQNRSLQEILQIVDRVEMAEIRLDRCPLSLEEIQTLFSFTDTPLIATCRVVDTAKAIADRSSALARALSAEEGRSPAQIAEERLLKAITKERNMTVIMICHDLNIAAKYSDRILMMSEGKIYASGTPEEVLTKENIRKVYDIDCEVIMDQGRPHILLRDDEPQSSDS